MLVFLLVLYAALTVVGLFAFDGLPVLNVALGFPVGALIARHLLARPPAGAEPSLDRGARRALKHVLTWSLSLAGLTLLVCWFQLAISFLILRLGGADSALAALVPLLSSPFQPGLFRAQVFALVLCPALVVLTTVFGGVTALLLSPSGEA